MEFGSNYRPLVSIVVPSYNAASYLPLLCRSLQSQTLADFEVLIGDDGSTDGTAAALVEFGDDSRFHFFTFASNRGVNQMTFFLLGKISGIYWCNPGADDLLDPDFLEKRVAKLEKNPTASLVHGPPRLIDEQGMAVSNNAPFWKFEERTPGHVALRRLLQHNYLNTPALLIRTAVTLRVLPHFDTQWQYAQDWFLWIMLAATGGDFLWDERTLHSYRIHATSLTNIAAKKATRQAEIRLVPLCALKVASTFSEEANVLWSRYGYSLYLLWLRRAALLARLGELRPEWLQISAQAFYGHPQMRISLSEEVLRHAIGMLLGSWREWRAKTGKSFIASGLVEVADPFFETSRTSSC